jgi:ribosomal protein S5
LLSDQKLTASLLQKGSGLRCNALVSDVLTCFGIKDMFVKVTGRRFMPHAFKVPCLLLSLWTGRASNAFKAIFEVLEKERSPLTIAKGLGKKFFDNNQAHMPRSPYGL